MGERMRAGPGGNRSSRGVAEAFPAEPAARPRRS
jgi:hypothetical protein